MLFHFLIKGLASGGVIKCIALVDMLFAAFRRNNI